MKPGVKVPVAWSPETFSILKRIELGETLTNFSLSSAGRQTFSILKRIELGETYARSFGGWGLGVTFSILKRIELGETLLNR